MRFASLVQFATLSALVAAYPTETPRDPSAPIQARDCSAHIDAFNKARRAKRSQNKRAFYSGIMNNTCITSPEVSGADNWVSGAPVRTDLTEGQAGIQLVMDVGVMDMSNCNAMSNALVELWSANAVGEYGATFLRGGTTTDSTGIAELNTIFPGFTSGSAAHLDIKVHPNWSGGSKITSSSASYIGRLYFTDQWSTVIHGAAPYNTNNVAQTPNSQDPSWSQASSAGYNPVIDIEEIHDDWPEGVLGYITVGVNPKSTFSN